MKREEVLERSRKDKTDEGKEFVFNKGRKTGFIGMLILFCILAVFNLYNNRQETNFALLSMMFGYLSCESFGTYNITKRKVDLFKIIIGFVVCIYFLSKYFGYRLGA